MWATNILKEDFGESYIEMLADLRNIIGVKRDYEQAVEEMEWTVDEYYDKYMKEVRSE
jgi:hypothetical protein